MSLTILWGIAKAAASWANRNLAWAGVILLVIAGFFWLQKHDESVRTAATNTCRVSILAAQLNQQTKRATYAETQRDLANAPPADIDHVLEWLRPSK